MASLREYLCYAGVEVANANRTLSYMRRAGISGFTAHTCDSDEYLVYGIGDGGANGNFSTPDHADLDITGDIDLRIAVAAFDWSGATTDRYLISKHSSGQRSYNLILPGSSTSQFEKQLMFSHSADGSVVLTKLSAARIPAANGEYICLRATLDVNSGGTHHVCCFYWKPVTRGPILPQVESNEGWLPLGPPQVVSGTTSIFSGTALVNLLRRSDGTAGSSTAGKVLAAVIKNGINGSTVANPDFTAALVGAATYTDATGKVWTPNSGADFLSTQLYADPHALCCHCHLISDLEYISPETDDAPWYDPSRSESADFLGIVPERIDLPSVLNRSVSPKDVGAIVGPLRPRHRILSFAGTMIAASQRGMAYGERWLNEVLAGSLCPEGCAEDEAEILPACPPEDESVNAMVLDGSNDHAGTPGWRAMTLDGTNDNASTPDHTSLDITGDLDVRVACFDESESDTTAVYVSKWGAGQRSWILRHATGTGTRLELITSPDGSATVNQTSSVDRPAGPIMLRVTLDVDDGAGNRVGTFYTKEIDWTRDIGEQLEDDDGWSRLGDVQTTAGATSIFAGTAPLRVGDESEVTGRCFDGFVYAVVVKSGISGDTVANPTFSNQDAGTTSFADGTGKTWTLNSGAAIALGTWSDYTTALDIIADIDIRVAAAADDWSPAGYQTLISKDQAAGQRAWQFNLDTASSGKLYFQHSADGTAGLGVTSSVAITALNGESLLVRVTLDVDNGAAGRSVRFFTKRFDPELEVITQLEDDSGWVPLGATQTTAGTTSIFIDTAPIQVGQAEGGQRFDGKIYGVVVKNGIDGNTVTSPDFSVQETTDTFFTDAQGNPWAMLNGAAIVSQYADAGSSRYLRRLLRAGVVDGPIFTPIGRNPECKLQTVAFQLAAGEPYLFGEPIEVRPPIVLTATESDSAAMASTNDWIGDAAVVITLEALETGTPTLTDHTGKVWTANGNAALSYFSRDRTALLLDGTGDFMETPDVAALDIVGDIDLRAAVALDDWTPAAVQTFISKYFFTGNQRSYLFQITTAGLLRLIWSADGTATITKDSTVAVSADNGELLLVRVTLDVNNGAAGNTVTFYTKPAPSIPALIRDALTDNTGWEQLGDSVVTAAATSIFSGTATVRVGAYEAASDPLDGYVLGAVIKNGIDGTVAADPDFSASHIDLYGRVSFDGSCPPATLVGGLDAEPCWDAHIHTLLPGAKLVIDATRRQVLYTDPSNNIERPGFDKLVVPSSGLFEWPIVPPCTDLCLTATRLWGNHVMRIEMVPREL